MKKIRFVWFFGLLTNIVHGQVFSGTPQTIDNNSNSVGLFSSMAIVNGNPAVAYYDQTDGDLKFIRAADATGSTWGTPQIVDGGNNVGRYASLAIINGNPAISYHDATNRSLKYIRANDTDGSIWGTPVTVELPQPGAMANNTGWHTSLVDVGGNPAISYLQFVPNGSIKYIRASDSNGATWGSPVIIDNPGPNTYSSMNIVNGNPAISYFHSNTNSLRYVRATDAVGASWGSPNTVIANEGVYSSLQIINGNPAISFTNFGVLYYVRATNIDGTNWNTAKAIDTGPVDYTSLASVAGLPAIAYSKSNNLRFVTSNDANGDIWRTPQIVDPATGTGHHPSLLSVVGVPAISYYDGSDGNLKYIRGNNPFPVKLVNFLGESSESLVKLNWQTSEEVNNQHFEIQHSFNAIHFETIGKVTGKGNTNAFQLYSFDDTSPKTGVNYYRLKQVDFNGSNTLSRIIAVTFTKTQEIMIFPNPATSRLEVALPKGELLRKAEIWSINGIKLLEASEPTLKIEPISSGSYWLKVTTETNQVILKKIIIHR